MLICPIISASLFITYILWVIFRWDEIPISISATALKWPKSLKGLFSLFLVSIGWTLYPVIDSYLLYSAIGGLTLVAAMWQFDYNILIKIVHYIGAVSAMVFAILSCWLDFGQAWAVYLSVGSAAILITFEGKWMFWLEVVVFLILYISIFISI